MGIPRASDVHFDIDDYINPYIFPSPLHHLPTYISRFLGYRKSPTKEVGNLLVAWWSLLGTFCGICVVAGVFNYSSVIQAYNPPVVIASFGATAILEYNVIQSPLAQPRNSIFGHGLAALVGVAITKLFMLSSSFERLPWVAGAFCCGVASSVMGLTNTVHPPGGATALLAAVDPTIRSMGWIYIPLVLLGSLLMLLTGLIINNIQRQFPVFWWTPADLSRLHITDIEKQSDTKEKDLEAFIHTSYPSEGSHAIIITDGNIKIPHNFSLGQEEVEVLEILRDRLRQSQFNDPRNTNFTRIQSRGYSNTSSEMKGTE